jgi:hypothetical protein
MMGKQNMEPVLFNYRVNLDARVRADHPLRKIKEKIGFSLMSGGGAGGGRQDSSGFQPGCDRCL